MSLVRDQKLHAPSLELSVDAILNRIPEPIVTINQSNIITFWNEAAEKTFGWTMSEVVGKALQDTILAGEIVALHNRREMVAKHKNGRAFPITMKIATEGKGDELKSYAIIQDISELKHAQEQLNIQQKEKLHELNMIFREMRNVIQANYALIDQATESMAKLIAQGSSYPLLASTIQPIIDLLNKANKSVVRLNQIINDVLDDAKLNVGTLTLTEKVFNPSLAIATALHGLKAKEQMDFKDKKIDIQVDTKSAETMVCMDEHRFVQVISNLVSNAQKFTKDKISIEAKVEHGILYCVIRDNGVGMSSDEVNKLFKSYTQTNDMVQHNHGGAGLGLAISKKLARLMDGDIDVTSQLGHGSVFRLTIKSKPLQYAAVVVPRDNSITKSLHADQKQLDTKYKHILIVDDMEINRKLLKRFCDNLGCICEESCTGQEAVNKYKQSIKDKKHFDIIFTDINMPVMNGYEAVRTIRSLEVESKNPQVPIIAVTTNDDEKHIAAAKQCGINDTITKPITRDKIVQYLTGVTMSSHEYPDHKGIATLDVREPVESMPIALHPGHFDVTQDDDVISSGWCCGLFGAKKISAAAQSHSTLHKTLVLCPSANQ